MNRSIRCRHGFDRDLVACPACGDTDRDMIAEAKNNAKRRPSRIVMNRPHGGSCRRERLAYATRERQAGR